MGDSTPRKITVGALVFPGFELLDLYGPLEMYAIPSEHFEIRVVAETGVPVAGNGGPQATPDDLMSDGRAYDVLLIPGGPGTRREIGNAAIIDWLKSAAANARLVTSVCTGAALLARAGLLDGRKATTNKMAWTWATAQGPDVDWQAKARWVEDGDVFTSAGVSAGIDMSLAAIARLIDTDTAEAVARMAEYDWHRDAGWDPFAQMAGLA
jgi:transcriptional regulator GlxA family with amidase domain